HDYAQDEPSSPNRALQRTADLRFSDTRVVAHWDFNHAETSQRAFEDHLNRPPIGGFFQRERAKYVGAAGAKRPEIAEFYSIEKPDALGGETTTNPLSRRQHRDRTSAVEAGANR